MASTVSTYIFTMQMSEKRVLTSHFNNGRLAHREVVQRAAPLHHMAVL